MPGTINNRNVMSPTLNALTAHLQERRTGYTNVPAPDGSGLSTFCAQHGGDIYRIFSMEGIDPDLLETPPNSISLATHCRILERAAAETRLDNFGLLYGQKRRPQMLGLIGYIGLNSTTVLDALSHIAADFPWHQRDTMVQLTDRGLCWKLEYQIQHEGITSCRQDAELTLITFLNLLRHALGPAWCPVEVHFEHPRPVNIDDHTRCFGTTPRFSQPTNALVIHKQDGRTPMPGADPFLLDVLRTVIRGAAAQDDAQDMLDQVRSQIRRALIHGEPRIEDIAEGLGLSAHSLQRKLSEHKCSFSQLVDELRFAMARHYLGETSLSISETAETLGYSETSAFSRAFRRWAGASPRAYRGAQERKPEGRSPRTEHQRCASSCARPRSSAPTSQSMSPVWKASGGLSFSTFP